jgi:hypothetical protein
LGKLLKLKVVSKLKLLVQLSMELLVASQQDFHGLSMLSKKKDPREGSIVEKVNSDQFNLQKRGDDKLWASKRIMESQPPIHTISGLSEERSWNLSVELSRLRLLQKKQLKTTAGIGCHIKSLTEERGDKHGQG